MQHKRVRFLTTNNYLVTFLNKNNEWTVNCHKVNGEKITPFTVVVNSLRNVIGVADSDLLFDAQNGDWYNIQKTFSNAGVDTVISFHKFANFSF